MWVILITGIIQLYYIYSTWSYNTCLIIKWKFIPNKKKRYRTIIISSVTDILIIHPFVYLRGLKESCILYKMSLLVILLFLKNNH